MTAERLRERRRGGRRTGGAARAGAGKPMANPAFRRLSNPYAPIEQYSADQIEAIHDTSLTILREIGIRVLSDQARQIYRAAGADVDEATKHVRIEAALVLDAVGRAPTQVTLRTRNPVRQVTAGGKALAFATVGGPPNVSDIENGRRPGTLAAFRDLARLAQSFDVIHLLNPMVEPMDVAPPFRHLRMTRTMVTQSDKVPFVYCRGIQAVADALDIIRLANGLTEELFTRTPCCFTVVNANSPLQLDDLMCKGIIEFARRGQLMILTPFTLAGAMAPITLPGALAQQNAEALAGIALAQMVRPGTPVAYGGFTSNVDMKSGAPAFGTPEYVKAAFASGQLARRYRLPFRSSNVNASNAPDAQAAYESQMALWGAIMGGCNLLMHGAGWLEGGLTASFEKFIIDVEMLQMFAALMQTESFDDDALALSAVREIEPGGHYFGTRHTLARYETAFYAPLLSDWRNFETWQESGALDATRRANRIYKQTLADFEPPALDASILGEIDDLIARRESEGGADLER